MSKRPFFSDPNTHADGPPRVFGRQGHPQRQLTPQQLRERDAHPIGILPAIQSLINILIVSLFLIAFTVQPIRIPSASMQPTLLVGDFLLLDKASAALDPGPLLPPTQINRGDVIVFHDPVDDPSVHLVKRVIALPGDTLHLESGTVILNNHPLAEPYLAPYLATPTTSSYRDPYRDDFPDLRTLSPGVNPAWWIQLRALVHNGQITVPPNSFFVMGDNRSNSEDSRYWGFVPRTAIVGKPTLIYFSWRQPPTEETDSTGILPRTLPGAANSSRPDFARWNRTFRVIH